MTILDFTKPKKARATEDHNATFSSDCGVEGTYVPNMSNEDAAKWRAKKIGGKHPRVEIRKTIRHHDPVKNWATSAQLVLIVRPDGTVKLSTNGAAFFTQQTWEEMQKAVDEAQAVLQRDRL